MAAKSEPTTEIPFRAAQGVSRFFLFEALRTGIEDMTIQHAELQLARDRAEGMLVKEQPQEYESMLREILQSCAKGLQTHASIVEAIAETLHAGDSVRDESNLSDRYSLLVGQIKDAAVCMKELMDTNVKKENSPPLPSENDFDSDTGVDSSKKSDSKQPTEPNLRKKAKMKHPLRKTSSETSDAKPMKGQGKKLSKPSPSSEAGETLSQPSPPPTALRDPKQTEFTQPPTTPLPTNSKRRTSYEDISSEVTARLAAKEAKRAKKKDSKKRKRDSLASEIFSPDPKATPEHVGALPPKKRVRVGEDEGEDERKGKRRNGDGVSGKAKVKKQKIRSVRNEDVKIGEAQVVQGEKAKRRRSSNLAETQGMGAQDAAPESNNRK